MINAWYSFCSKMYIYQLIWAYIFTNEKLLKVTKTSGIASFCKIQHLKYLAHVTRLENNSLQKQMLFSANHKNIHETNGWNLKKTWVWRKCKSKKWCWTSSPSDGPRNRQLETWNLYSTSTDLDDKKTMIFPSIQIYKKLTNRILPHLAKFHQNLMDRSQVIRVNPP